MLCVRAHTSSQGLIGGRTYHRTGLFDWPVDLGGEFIHGELTHFKELCDTFGISTVRTFSSFPPTPYFEDGRPVAEYIWLGQESKLMSWVWGKTRFGSSVGC
jgi:hypothetical protein